MSGMSRGTPLGWGVLLLAGQGAVLALTQSGKEVTYPHFQFARLASGPTRVATAILVVQLAAVAWGMWGAWPDVRRWVRQTFSPLALAAAGAVLVLLSAVASRDPRLYVAELAVASLLQVTALLTVLLLARSLDDAAVPAIDRHIGRWLGGEGGPGRGRLLEPFALACAGAVLVTCALLAVVVYERMPHVPDEIVYLLQARYFAAGRLQLPAPPVPAAFDIDLIHYEPTRIFSPLPPGWPALLAVGVALGVPWLVNPLLAALGIVLAHALLQRLMPARAARLATLLLATSPWFLFLGMSLMTHAATLACALAAALGIAVAQERRAAWPAALAGVAVGIVALIRPLEGVAVALGLGVWSLWVTHRAFRLLPSVALTLATAATAALNFPYNRALSGDPRRFPVMMYVDKYYHPGANDMGFGPERGMGWGGLDPWPGHGLRDVVLNTLLNGAATNLELFGWACGSLVLLVAVVASRRAQRLEWAMVAAIALVVVLHAFYWFGGGPDFAARYWYLIIVPAVVLTARAPALLFGRGTPAATRATVGMLALTAGALVTWMPWRSVEKYHGFRYMTADMRRFVAEHDLGAALVLVRGRRHPDYHQAALENPMDLRDATRPVFAWDRTAAIRRAAVAAYPDRPVYVVDGPTITGGGFRIVAGPLPPGSLASELPSSGELPVVVGGDRNAGAQRRSP